MDDSNQISAPFFKGWAKPGPDPNRDSCDSPPIEPDETLDAISGYFRIFQLRDGHRFSTDDILTAWYGTTWCPCARRILDLGSGIGTAGLVAAWRLVGAQLVAIEAQADSVRLARKSVCFNRLESRCEIRHGDFRESSLLAGDEWFDLILGTPPYFPPGTGVQSEHPQKIACRFEQRGSIADYCAVASDHLAPGGLFTCVFPADQHERVAHAAKDAGLILVRLRPVVFRAGDAPIIELFAMMRADQLPPGFREKTWVEPALTIRQHDGTVHPEYQALKLAIGFPP